MSVDTPTLLEALDAAIAAEQAYLNDGHSLAWEYHADEMKRAARALSRHAPQIKAMVEENERLRKALTTVRPLYASFVEDTGGCDHSVGLCACADYAALAMIDAALKEPTDGQ